VVGKPSQIGNPASATDSDERIGNGDGLFICVLGQWGPICRAVFCGGGGGRCCCKFAVFLNALIMRFGWPNSQ